MTITMSSRSRYGSRADIGVPGCSARPAARPAARIRRRTGSIGSSTSTWKVIESQPASRKSSSLAAGLGDHQVGVERRSRPRRRRLIVVAAERQVRHELAVHDVEVDPVGAGLDGAADLAGRGWRGRRRGCSRRCGAAAIGRLTPCGRAASPRPVASRRRRSAADAGAAPAARAALAARGRPPRSRPRGGSRRRGDAPGRRSARPPCSAASWPQAAPDLLATVAPDRHPDPGRAEARREAPRCAGTGWPATACARPGSSGCS